MAAVTVEALRPRRKGEKSVVDTLVEHAAKAREPQQIAQYLHLYMACLVHKFFDINLVVAKRGLRFLAATLIHRSQV